MDVDEAVHVFTEEALRCGGSGWDSCGGSGCDVCGHSVKSDRLIHQLDGATGDKPCDWWVCHLFGATLYGMSSDL